MGKLEREITKIPCPNCKRDIEVTYINILNQREAKCNRCRSMYKFSSSDTSNLRSAISNLERAQEKFSDAFHRALKGADIIIKNR